jgi:tetratricopeptide (TPR) repeat protein
MLTLVLPILLLGLAELVLRVAGYGYSTSFFAEWREPNGNKSLINNENFSLRFFPPGLARWPGPFKIAAEKPPGIRRIFVFGESAAMGDPQPSYGVSRYLEVLLRERFPQEKFEVINLGITAVNSHVILPIARECARRPADIWIIYTGNNEMVGPFGAATVFGGRAPPLWVARLKLAIQRTRVGQLAVGTIYKLNRGSTKNPSWGGMRMFLENQISPTDPRKERVYHNFESNLRGILQAGKKSGAQVILSTMSVNLRDCPPFGSFVNSNQPAADQEQFDRLYANARELQNQSNYAGAARQFAEAARLNPFFAELHFHWGDCLLAMTNVGEAREHFQLACDNDALPFRADSRINDIIRRLGKELGGEHLTLCDAESEMQQGSSVGVAGGESFFEHVHFNFEGNCRLARIWAAQMEPLISVRKDAKNGTWASQEECDRQLGLTGFNRAYVLQSVIRRMGQPPLSSRYNNVARVKLLEVEEARVQQELKKPDALPRAKEIFDVAIRRAPDDYYLHEGLGNLLESIGDNSTAITWYRRALAAEPQDYYARLRLGHLLGEQGAFAEATSFLTRVVEIRPSLPESWYELARVQTSSSNYVAALRSFDEALRLRPQDASFEYYRMYCQGKLYAKENHHAAAVEEYRKAIALLPENWEAHFELGGELDAATQLEAAAKEFGEAANLNPRYSRTHFNHGVLLAKLGRFDQAQTEFEETIRLEPGYPTAHQYLQQIQVLRDKNKTSVSQ